MMSIPGCHSTRVGSKGHSHISTDSSPTALVPITGISRYTHGLWPLNSLGGTEEEGSPTIHLLGIMLQKQILAWWGLEPRKTQKWSTLPSVFGWLSDHWSKPPVEITQASDLDLHFWDLTSCPTLATGAFAFKLPVPDLITCPAVLWSLK